MIDRYLVIGGGCAGTAAIKAIRRCYLGFEDEVDIIATTKSRHPVDGANEVLLLKLTEQNVLTDHWLERLLPYRPFKATFFTPGYGGVGVPVDQATEQEKRHAYNYSVRPLIRLEACGGFGTLVAFSPHLWLPFLRRWYGPVAHSKVELEAWFRENPRRRQLVRFGTINTPSLRRIGTAVEQLLKRGLIRIDDPGKEFPLVPNASELTLPQAMLAQMLAEERKIFKVERNTTPDDLEGAIHGWLTKQEVVNKIVNVVGDLNWFGDERIPFERILPECVALHRRFCDNLWVMPELDVPPLLAN